MKIFISIASFQDPILKYTLHSLIKNANKPERFVIGIFDQTIDPIQDVIEDYRMLGIDIKYKICHPEDSKGVCWARSTIQQELFKGEDYYLQLDSHMMFDKDWDEIILKEYKTCQTITDKPIVSCYPPAFDVLVENGGFFNSDAKYIFRKRSEAQHKTHVMTMHKPFSRGLHSFQIGKYVKDNLYYRGYAMAGGYILAQGKWVEDVPYDPRIYFHGEETTLSLRSFTNGYDIFHTPSLPLYHWYNHDKLELKRELHWERHKEPYEQIDKKSLELTTKILGGKEKGKYGLGNKRTIEEYAEISGIDYINKSYQPDKSLFEDQEGIVIEGFE